MKHFLLLMVLLLTACAGAETLPDAPTPRLVTTVMRFDAHKRPAKSIEGRMNDWCDAQLHKHRVVGRVVRVLTVVDISGVDFISFVKHNK